MKTIYLDNAATTKLDKRVLEAMIPWFESDYGNASSIHHLGRKATVAIEDARITIAHYIGAEPAEIIFTSGGTESDNAVIKGVMNSGFRSEIISSNAEHHAILHPVEHANSAHFIGTILEVNQSGIITKEVLASAISEQTALVSLMHINNENGAIHDLKALSDIAHAKNALFHSDCVQSAGKLPIHVDELGLDFMSVSAHKIHGPKGVGFLYARSGVDWKPFMEGGSQERKRRAGTLNVPGIVGLGKAFELAHQEMNERKQHISMLKNRLEKGLKERFAEAIQFNNPIESDSFHIVNVSFNYGDSVHIDGEMLLLNLDIEGICTSNGSACTSGAVEPSHVLLALGVPSKIAKSSVRLSLSKDNTLEEIEYTLEKLEKIIHRMIKR